MSEVDMDELGKLIDSKISKALASQAPKVETKEAPQEAQTHAVTSWMKSCPTCGDANPEYKAPDVYCKDCEAPLGNAPEGFTSGDLPDIKPCWNCGSSDAKLMRPKKDE